MRPSPERLLEPRGLDHAVSQDTVKSTSCPTSSSPICSKRPFRSSSRASAQDRCATRSVPGPASSERRLNLECDIVGWSTDDSNAFRCVTPLPEWISPKKKLKKLLLIIRYLYKKVLYGLICNGCPFYVSQICHWMSNWNV